MSMAHMRHPRVFIILIYSLHNFIAWTDDEHGKMKNYVIYVFIFGLLSKAMLKEPWNIRMECNEASGLVACATEWHSQLVSAVKHIKTSFSKWAATRKIMSALIILIFSCSLLNIWCFFWESFFFSSLAQYRKKKQNMNSFWSFIQNELLFF